MKRISMMPIDYEDGDKVYLWVSLKLDYQIRLVTCSPAHLAVDAGSVELKIPDAARIIPSRKAGPSASG